jgi:hypothetical protein
MKLWPGLLGMAALCGVAGCAPRYLPVDGAGRITAVPPPANISAPPSAHDTCGADKLQYLIGKSRLQIPVAVDISKRRVACTTCVLSHLDDPSRITILFDETTGLVTSVKCQ